MVWYGSTRREDALYFNEMINKIKIMDDNKARLTIVTKKAKILFAWTMIQSCVLVTQQR